MNKAIHVKLFGQPQVTLQGNPFVIPRNQVRGLLYRLAAEGDFLSRSYLGFLFWPETPEDTARRRLTRLLSYLNQNLPRPEAIIVQTSNLRVNPDVISSDVQQFVTRIGNAHSIQVKEQAAALYSGRFLAGFSLGKCPEYDLWMTNQQRYFQDLMLHNLKDLLVYYRSSDNFQKAIPIARRYLKISPLSEEVHRELMALYAAAGRRREAILQFEACAAALERELGLFPLPETMDLYHQIVEGQMHPISDPLAGSSLITLPSLDFPLTGRAGVMEDILDRFSGVHDNQALFYCIIGEPGMGKTRLMGEFCRRVLSVANILTASARSCEGAIPFQPIVEALRTIPNLEKTLQGLDPVWLAEAGHILPEIRKERPDLPAPLSVTALDSRARLHQALFQIMLYLTRISSKPVLLCLDDLQWMDSASLDWLKYLFQYGQEKKIFVLGACRKGDTRILPELRQSLGRRGQLVETMIEGLDLDAVQEIVKGALMEPLGADLIERLHQITGGNPFFILEVLQALRKEANVGNQFNLSEFPLPEGVRSLIRNRLNELNAGTKQVLETGAVLGAAFDLKTLQETTGKPAMLIIEALEECVHNGLLIENGGRHQFKHALLHQSVLDSLSPLRRSLLHRRVADALSVRQPRAVQAIGRHYDLAGEKKKALRYYQKAVNQADRLFAWQEAIKLETHMLSLLDELTAMDNENLDLTLKWRLIAQRAHHHYLLGNLDARDADLTLLEDEARKRGDDKLWITVFLNRVRYANLSGDYKTALKIAEKGLRISLKTGCKTEQIRFLSHIGFGNYFLGHPLEALEALEDALRLAGDTMDPEWGVRAFHILGYIHYHLGNFSVSLEYHQEALAYGQTLGDENRTAWNLMDLGFLHLKCDRIDKAENLIRDSLSLARRIKSRPAEAFALTIMGDWAFYQGRYEQALNQYQSSAKLHKQVDSKHGHIAAEDGCGLVFLNLGCFSQARKHLLFALEKARDVGHRRHIGFALIGLGMLAIGEEAMTQARIHLDEALSISKACHCTENFCAAQIASAILEQEEKNFQQALVHIQKACALAKRHHLYTCQAWADLQHSKLYHQAGDLPEAVACLTPWLEPHAPMHETWCPREKVFQMHARIMRSLGRHDLAKRSDKKASSILDRKANLISDSVLRSAYLKFTQHQGG